MTNTIENDLKDLNPNVLGVFELPKMPDGIFGTRPADKHDTDLAEDLFGDWWVCTTKSVGEVRFYAIPEVLKKDRTTRTPLHYHALFRVIDPRRFMKVAPRKWINRQKRLIDGCKPAPLRLRLYDHTMPESHEFYCLKNTLADWGWGRTHIITEEDVCPRYMRTTAT